LLGTVSAPSYRRFADLGRSYPALLSSMALLLLCVIPVWQYHDSVVSDDARIGSAVSLAESAVRGGDYSYAAKQADYAMALSRRPWPRTVTFENRLDLARALTIKVADTADPAQRIDMVEQALALYTAAWLERPTSSPAALAGVVALRDAAWRDNARRDSVAAAARAYGLNLSEGELPLSAVPSNGQRTAADLREFYSTLLALEATLADFAAYDGAYHAAVAALPGDVQPQMLVTGSASGSVRLPGARTDLEVRPNSRITIPRFAGSTSLIRWSDRRQGGLRDGLGTSSVVRIAPQDDRLGQRTTQSDTPPPLILRLRRDVLRADADSHSGDQVSLAEANQLLSWAASDVVRTNDPSLMGSVCWMGGLDGFADVVLDTCWRATYAAGASSIMLDELHDALAVAYATAGHYSQAREELRRTSLTFTFPADYAMGYSTTDAAWPSRPDLEAQLADGVDPFTPELRDRLRARISTRAPGHVADSDLATYVTLLLPSSPR